MENAFGQVHSLLHFACLKNKMNSLSEKKNEINSSFNEKHDNVTCSIGIKYQNRLTSVSYGIQEMNKYFIHLKTP